MKSINSEKSIFSLKFAVALIATILVTFFVSKHFVTLSVINGPSMLPTFESGDVVLVNKLAADYERFDVVIIEMPNEKLIKRVVALPGETVQIKDGYIYINGKKLDDVVSEKTSFAGTAFYPLTLAEDEYFVLGDNRENSTDSRYEEVGAITADQLYGRVIISIIPPKQIK